MLNLKERRRELGLSLIEVANAVGVSEATISRYESGNIKNMRRDRIENYAKVLRVSIPVFLGIDDDYIETHEFLKTITDPEHTSVQVKEQDAYIDELIAQSKKSAPTEEDSESVKKIKEIIEKISQLSDSDLIQLDNFVSFLVAQSKGKTED